MIRNQEEDEFVAVRVQDPRVQNEGSWNSYVDYKIFLHTNSKAFTAKTSCVRRRYSEFAWLRKKLQKNAGLVPVPDLPGKSFFSFSNEDFLEARRKGLQVFLDKVVHMTVCLSDSQLHLFLQTQLPVGHIQDCVQGHTPYSVMDAILTYASSNRGFAQAQEEDPIKEPSLTVSYESMESPAPHQPCPQTKDTHTPELLSCSESDPLEGLLEDPAESQHKEESSITVLQKNNHLEAVIEDCSPGEASFFLGDSPRESLSLSEQSQPRSCLIQTPVEVHSPMGTGFEEESAMILQTEKEDEEESPAEANIEKVNCDPGKEMTSDVLDLKDGDAELQEDVTEDVCTKTQVLENHRICEDNNLELVCGTEEDAEKSNHDSETELEIQKETLEEAAEQDAENRNKSESREETVHEETPDEENDFTAEETDQKEKEDMVGGKDESDEENHSVPSSNGSIVKVSDEESVCDEAEEANSYMKTLPETWSEEEPPSRHILDLHINGCPEDKEDLQYTSDISDFSKSVELHSAVTGGDVTENSDFSVLETSCSPVMAESKYVEQEELDVSEEAQEVEGHQLDS